MAINRQSTVEEIAAKLKSGDHQARLHEADVVLSLLEKIVTDETLRIVAEQKASLGRPSDATVTPAQSHLTLVRNHS
jgi:hypothetical protein